jgi:hypothetical protein
MRPGLRPLSYLIAAVATATALASLAAPAAATVGVWQASTSAVATSTWSRALNVPTGATAGEILLAQLVTSQSTMTGTTAPAGWSPACSVAGTGVSQGLWWRAVASEPASYTWTLPPGTGVVGNMSRISGVNTTSPIDVCTGSATATGSLSLPAPGITINGGDALIYAAYAVKGAATVTPPTGYTERVDAKTAGGAAGSVSGELSDRYGGSCGTATCTISAASATATMVGGEPTPPQSVGIQISLRPALAPAPTNTVAPTNSGAPQVGSSLNAENGTWVGWQTIGYTYQWQDCTTSCANLSGATGPSLTLTAAHLRKKLRVAVTMTSTGGASATAYGPSTRPIGRLWHDFAGSDGIITNAFAFYSPSIPGIYTSPVWEVTSGCLYRDSNTGGSRVPDTTAPSTVGCSPNNGNNVFRLNTRSTFSGNTDVYVDTKIHTDNHDAGCTTTCTNGIHIWNRHRTEADLYAVSVARVDDTITIKRKVPCGPSNDGTYFTLARANYPWTAGTTDRWKVTTSDSGSSVVISLYDLDSATPTTPVLTGTDFGGTNLNWTADCTAAGKYGSTSYPALLGTTPQQAGFRGDFTNFTIDNFAVVAD